MPIAGIVPDWLFSIVAVATVFTSLFNNTSTGAVNATSGTIAFNNGGASNGSFVAGGGEGFNFGGGTYNLNVGSSVSVAGTIGITGGSLNFNAPASWPKIILNSRGRLVPTSPTRMLTITSSNQGTRRSLIKLSRMLKAKILSLLRSRFRRNNLQC